MNKHINTGNWYFPPRMAMRFDHILKRVSKDIEKYMKIEKLRSSIENSEKILEISERIKSIMTKKE